MSPVFGTIGLAPTGMRCAEGEQVHQATIYVRHLVEGNIPSRGNRRVGFGTGNLPVSRTNRELGDDFTLLTELVLWRYQFAVWVQPHRGLDQGCR